MKKVILILVAIFAISVNGSAQEFLGQTMSQVEQSIKKIYPRVQLSYERDEKRGNEVLTVNKDEDICHFFTFGKNGVCVVELIAYDNSDGINKGKIRFKEIYDKASKIEVEISNATWDWRPTFDIVLYFRDNKNRSVMCVSTSNFRVDYSTRFALIFMLNDKNIERGIVKSDEVYLETLNNRDKDEHLVIDDFEK